MIRDVGVGGSDHYVGVGIPGAYLPAGQGDTRGSVARLGLRENLLGRDFRELLPHYGNVRCCRYNPETGVGIRLPETVAGELNQAASAVCQIEELFGLFCRAEREKARALSARHDNYMCGHCNCEYTHFRRDLGLPWLFSKKIKKNLDN